MGKPEIKFAQQSDNHVKEGNYVEAGETMARAYVLNKNPADDGAMRRNHWLGKTMLELARVPGTGKAWWPLLPADYMQATYQRMPRLNPINLDAIIRIFWQII